VQNFTFKVIPNQAGSENKNNKQGLEKQALEPESTKMPNPCPCPPHQEPIYDAPKCPPQEPIYDAPKCPPQEPVDQVPCPCPPMEPIYEAPCPCPPMGPLFPPVYNPCPSQQEYMYEAPGMPCSCPPMNPMSPQMPCPGMSAPCPGMSCPGSPCPGMPSPYGGNNTVPGNNTVSPFMPPYFRLAHAYVPWQYINSVFPSAEALCKGTLFPELHMPQGQYGPCEGPRPCKVYFGGGAPYGCK